MKVALFPSFLSRAQCQQLPSVFEAHIFTRQIGPWICVSHGGDYEAWGLLGCNTCSSEGRAFRRNISPPTSGSKSKSNKKPAEMGRKLSRLLLLVSFFPYSSTLITEATFFSETSGSLQTTSHYKPQDRTLQI
jgi:hypothetical protein